MSRTYLLAGVAACALCAVPLSAANAQNIGGFVSGQYGSLDGDDSWTIGGALAGEVFEGINLQGDVGYSTIDTALDVDTWRLGGSAFYRAMMGAVGANVSYLSADLTVVDVDGWSYGVFGEFYAGDMFTLAAKGGWYSADSPIEGGYIGGSAKFYAMPDLSFNARINYVDDDFFGDATTYGVGAEYLIGMGIPVSVYGGYDRADTWAGDYDIWTIGLRVLFGESSNGSLRDGDRTGAVRDTGMNILGLAGVP